MARQPDINEVLNSLSKEELIRIILQAADQDEMFKNGLLVKYAQGDYSGQLQLSKKLMDSIVNRYVGRDGFIPYRETHSFAMDMLALLEGTAGAKNSILALEIALLVLQEGVEAFQYADDSDGNIGMLVAESLDKVDDLASSLDGEDSSLQERFFDRLLTLSDSEIFEEWEDYKIELLRICVGLAGTEQLREQLKEKIERQIEVCTHKKYGGYTVEALLKLLLQLIRSYGSEEEVDNFVKDHLQYTFFRQSAIEASMECGDYHHVLELAQEGERQDQQLPGLVTQWKKARYEAYKRLSLKNEQQLLARELLMGGDYAYYKDLELLAGEGKKELYHGILAELKNGTGWKAQGVYLKLIADKDDLEEMMAYLRTTPSAVEEYAARLSPNYPEEIERIYRGTIYAAAESSSNRQAYQRVCGMLTRYQTVFGKPSRDEIILQLKDQYTRRPAFLDELSRVK